MSARTFFNIRYVYPGFTFILGIILVNQYLIFNNIIYHENINFTFLIAIVTIVGVSPLGLLLSQFWHVFFNFIRLLIGVRFLRYSSKYLLENKYLSKNISNKKHTINDLGVEGNLISLYLRKNFKLLILRDYILHYIFSFKKSGHIEMEYLRTFLSRKWDLMNTVGSGAFSYMFGMILGYMYRIWLLSDSTKIYLFNETIKINNITTLNNVSEIIIDRNFKYLPNSYYFYLIVFTITFLIVSIIGVLWINWDRQSFLVALFKKSNITKEDIKSAFPEIKFICEKIQQNNKK